MTPICSIVVAVCFFAQADDTKKEIPVGVAKYFEQAETQRKAAIITLESEIKTRIAQNAKRKLGQDAKREQGKLIADMKRDLERLKKNQLPFIPTLKPFKLAVGQAGEIELDAGFSAVSFVSPTGGPVMTTPGQSETSLRVFQVIGPRDMLIEPFYYAGTPPVEKRGQLFWVKGLETKTFAENSKTRLPGKFYVSENKTYNTQLGQQTVFVIELIDVEPWQEKKGK